MDIGILYAVVAGVGMLVDGVILSRIIATRYKDSIDKHLCKLLIFFMFFSAVDMIWGLFMSETMLVDLKGYRIFTYAFHLCASFSAFFWAGYSSEYMMLSRRANIILNILRTVLLGVQLYIIIGNIWNRRFFEINDDYVYIPYDMRTVNFIIQFSYYILLILTAVIACKLTKDEKKYSKCREVVSFSLVPFAFGIGQVLWPDAPMYSLGFMVTSVLIYLFIVTKYREEYLSKTWQEENDKLLIIASGLSEDFKALYYVDMDTEDFERYTNTMFMESHAGKAYVSDHDFFDKMKTKGMQNVHHEDREMVQEMLSREHIRKELMLKRSFSFNYRVIKNGVLRYYMIKVISPSSIHSNSNKIIVGVFDDDGRVHEEMEKNEQLRIAMEKAESANRAKTSFLFSMSHDVRTPMNAILGFTDIAKKNVNNPEKVEECLEKVSTASQHLLSLINDVLSMSRLEAGKIEIKEMPNSIKRMIVQIVSIVNGRAVMNDIRLTYDYSKIRDEFVFCDVTHFNQIMINILSNAVKYTGTGGKVELIAEQEEDKDGYGSYLFKVKDNGIGMSKEFLEHIFDEFAREQSATLSGVEGTGLGMSIVKRLIDSMDGTISIESEQNVGTTVTCRLNFRRCTEADAESLDEEKSTSETKIDSICGRRILLVDDNELNREIASDTLKEMGLEIEEATDGQDAVEILEKKGPGYYWMVLMDVQMPRMDGYTATRAIRAFENEELASIPIVAMTANAFEEDKRNALNAGMNDHIVKPINAVKVKGTLLKYV